MENKLEQLLNSLIEKGWKPRGDKNWENNTRITNIYFRQDENGKLPYIRMIVSKESGLWQFVCENGMIKHDQYTNTTRIQEYEDERDSETYRTQYGDGSYLFRIIQSSLRDESELESFILDNIKVEGQQHK